MNYEYTCKNEKCVEKDMVKVANMGIKEYSEAKLPLCEACKEPTKRIFSPIGHQTFGDGFKS